MTLNINIKENRGKTSAITIPGPYTTTPAHAEALAVELRKVIHGKIVSGSITAPPVDATAGTGAMAVDLSAPPVTAQRGQKWLVIGKAADTGKIRTFTIPCANSSVIAASGSDDMDLTTEPGSLLATQINARWVDEDGKAVTVQRITYRNYTLQ